jgi:hypothetical protein
MIGIGTPRIQSTSPREKFMIILLLVEKAGRFVGRSTIKTAYVGNLTHLFVVGSMGGAARNLTHCSAARAGTKS